jgi:hypothetical protein
MGRSLFGCASDVAGRAHAAEPQMSQPRAPFGALDLAPVFKFKELAS